MRGSAKGGAAQRWQSVYSRVEVRLQSNVSQVLHNSITLWRQRSQCVLRLLGLLLWRFVVLWLVLYSCRQRGLAR